MSLLLLLTLPRAEAGPDNEGACDVKHGYGLAVVESSCTKESKTCKALIEKENLPKVKECGTPQKGLKRKVPESVPKACQKEAAALADRANKGEMKDGPSPIPFRRLLSVNPQARSLLYDLAGGIVVHITAGVAALVACVMFVSVNTRSPHALRIRARKDFIPQSSSACCTTQWCSCSRGLLLLQMLRT
jgi:hypothetical protein